MANLGANMKRGVTGGDIDIYCNVNTSLPIYKITTVNVRAMDLSSFGINVSFWNQARLIDRELKR